MLAVVVELDAVQDHEAAAVQGVAGHERLRQEVQTGAVDDHPRPSHRVDERPARPVAQDEDLTALGAVHEGLPDVAVDDQLAALGDLSHLVLGVAVDVHLEAVHAAGGVVAVGAVEVDAHAVGGRAQTHAMEALAAQAIDAEVLPAQLVGLAHEHRVAVVAFGREALAVDAEQLFAGLRGLQTIAGVPVDPSPEAIARLAEERSGVEQLVEGVFEDADHGRAPLVAGREAAVVQIGEQDRWPTGTSWGRRPRPARTGRSGAAGRPARSRCLAPRRRGRRGRLCGASPAPRRR